MRSWEGDAVGSGLVAGEMLDRDEVPEFVRKLQAFVDDGARDTVALDVTNKSTQEDVQFALVDHFRRPGAGSAVALIYRNHFVGVVTRHSLASTLATAGGPSVRTGAGEQITLPGESSRYRLLELACPKCEEPQISFDIFYDAAAPPSCPEHNVFLKPRFLDLRR